MGQLIEVQSTNLTALPLPQVQIPLNVLEADLGDGPAIGILELPLAQPQDGYSVRKFGVKVQRGVPEAAFGEYLIMILSEEHSAEAWDIDEMQGIQEHTVGLASAGSAPIDAHVSRA